MVQVIQKALDHLDCVVTPITHPQMARFIKMPQSAAGYICHLEEHWFTIRPVNGTWWNFDSLLPAPARVGEAYLETFLFTLRQQDWGIYVVEGNLPNCSTSKASCTPGQGRLWTTAEVRAPWSCTACPN
jgi:Ataxin-3